MGQGPLSRLPMQSVRKDGSIAQGSDDALKVIPLQPLEPQRVGQESHHVPCSGRLKDMRIGTTFTATLIQVKLT
jgi:hypothetical protein